MISKTQGVQEPLKCGHGKKEIQNPDVLCSACLGILQEFQQTHNQHGVLCKFGSHTFVPDSWACQKQTAVSHGSIEAEITSLDAELRMEGITALNLWDTIMDILHSQGGGDSKSWNIKNLFETLTVYLRTGDCSAPELHVSSSKTTKL